ncbi:MAG: glycine cleavage system protein H [Polyangiaceae bacterium UTPRO1]|jgi:glycine cleavage system H protein|nr:glycine cleavage system protein GcvH [Myxococcales bacterium]OQY66966.1 MAG: glycine cleavage system protein H [Polyangiaceae bacterium UTPRO1]
MQIPETLRYSEEHEWVLVDDGVATIGITDHAQEELGDIVFVELPAIGAELAKAATLGVVESVKAVSDVYAPIGGTVTAVNGALADKPETINEDPYGAGWLVKVAVADPGELDGLMTAAQYRDFLAGGKA